jgi:hypothetical protein
MYELPENLADLSSEELQALIDSGLDALRALGVTPESDEETIAEGERIMGLITNVQAVKGPKDNESSRASRAQALIEAATPTEPTPPPDPNEPPPDPNAPQPNEPVVTDETVTPDEVIQNGEPVAASGRQSPARRAAANAAPPTLPKPRSQVASLTAAADVPGIPTGSSLDGLQAACSAVVNRMKGFPTQRIGGPEGVSHRYGAALIRKEGWGDLIQDAGLDDYSLVQRAGLESRLPGGSLVAAGGWCSPSETLYDLCQFETVQGILDLPEIGITRGGIRWTAGPDFGDIYTECGFGFTEAAVIAGTATKTCCIVDCPPFEDIRADLVGLCVKAPLLTQATYPELVRRFMEGALVAHQHKVNAYLINTIEMAAGTPSYAADLESISLSLAAIGYTATGMRYRYRLGESTTIEVIAPWWLKQVIKDDLGMRTWNPDASDAAVAKWFSDRNMSVQWVFDFQDPTVDAVNECLVTLPDPVRVLMYPAGTWVKGSIDVINVDAVYDSTSLESNIYTALFIEEGILAVQRCTHTCAVDIPVCVSGRTAANDVVACLWPPTATAPIP